MREETKKEKDKLFREIRDRYCEERAMQNLRASENAIKENTSFYRRRLGLTQDQLAQILGISRIHIANIESLTVAKVPSREMEYRIAEALQITPQELETPLGASREAPKKSSL